VITMTKQYDDILSELVARHAVQRTLSLRRRPFDMWFDSECRSAKISVLAVERTFRRTSDPLDQTVWISCLPSMHSMFRVKKANYKRT